MKNLNRIYLALAFGFTVVGVVQCVRWSGFGEVGILYLLNFLPAGAFGLAYVAGRRFPRERTHIAAIPFCVVAVVFWGFVSAGIEMFINLTKEVIDVGEYEAILDEYWGFDNHRLVTHFPRPIPPEATGMKFSFLPGFLQGGAHIQLRCTLPAERISELYERFSKMKTKSFMGGDTNTHMNMEEGMPTTFFYTSDSANHKFPDDYEVMIFDEVLKKEDRPEGHYWNHGDSHGVAISKERSEIVYWAESW